MTRGRQHCTCSEAETLGNYTAKTSVLSDCKHLQRLAGILCFTAVSTLGLRPLSHLTPFVQPGLYVTEVE